MDCDDIGDDLHEFMDNLKLNSNFKYAERDIDELFIKCTGKYY